MWCSRPSAGALSSCFSSLHPTLCQYSGARTHARFGLSPFSSLSLYPFKSFSSFTPPSSPASIIVDHCKKNVDNHSTNSNNHNGNTINTNSNSHYTYKNSAATDDNNLAPIGVHLADLIEAMENVSVKNGRTLNESLSEAFLEKSLQLLTKVKEVDNNSESGNQNKEKAFGFLKRALVLDPNNVQVKAKLAEMSDIKRAASSPLAFTSPLFSTPAPSLTPSHSSAPSSTSAHLVSSPLPTVPKIPPKDIAPVSPSASALETSYFSKWLGMPGEKSPPRPTVKHIVASSVLSLTAMGIVSYVHHFAAPDFLPHLLGISNPMMMTGSFGASAALVFGAPDTPVAQPRNVIFGHAISACVGVATWALLSPYCDVWTAGPISVSLSIAAMLTTRTFHPPAAGNGLIYMMGGLDHMGWHYVIAPCFLGPSLIVFLGLIGNNLLRFRRYPKSWL